MWGYSHDSKGDLHIKCKIGDTWVEARYDEDKNGWLSNNDTRITDHGVFKMLCLGIMPYTEYDHVFEQFLSSDRSDRRCWYLKLVYIERHNKYKPFKQDVKEKMMNEFYVDRHPWKHPPIAVAMGNICQVIDFKTTYYEDPFGNFTFKDYVDGANLEPEYHIRSDRHHTYRLKDFVKKVYFNEPYTIVIWADGDKTIVRCSEKSTYDKYTGFTTCFVKKLMGDYGFPTYKKVVRNIIKEDECKK